MLKIMSLFNNTLVIGIILILLSVSIFSVNGIIFNDTSPPVTTISLVPPYPDGENGWYLNDVCVILNATDDLSGVKEIHYRTPKNDWNILYGDLIEFILDYNCSEDGLIEYFAIDLVGNVEETKTFIIDIDQIPPVINSTCEFIEINPIYGWKLEFTCFATDNCSGMDRVEFYFNNQLQSTVSGPGPEYVWTVFYFPLPRGYKFFIKAYDLAGNYNLGYIRISDINSNFRYNFINKNSNYIFSNYFLCRFLLLARLAYFL
ncbi:hypothetical protein AYK20_03560 [Thermoplasmatales archaeon SG8-52-1]|nr:MAG: hypothetical protein AYK20_03560 [Thermoplasmatales archaeon SG8-52-1]